jgi:hypothetical protein
MKTRKRVENHARISHRIISYIKKDISGSTKMNDQSFEGITISTLCGRLLSIINERRKIMQKPLATKETLKEMAKKYLNGKYSDTMVEEYLDGLGGIKNQPNTKNFKSYDPLEGED